MLYVVGTPIGNIQDISTRAVETLQKVDLIACEDTRHTGLLLSRLGIKKPLISYYQHTEEARTALLIEKLKEGQNIALVSDAGMPVISDPGAVLVEAAHKEGLEVSVVPGPTAVTSAVALAGIRGGFVFIGFLAEKNKDKEGQITPFITSPLPLVFYCASHDLADTFSFLLGQLGDRRVWVVKELTKMYEGVFDTRLSGEIDFDTHGEFVLIVEGKAPTALTALPPVEHLRRYLELGMDKKEAIKRVAAERGVKKDEIYKIALEL